MFAPELDFDDDYARSNPQNTIPIPIQVVKAEVKKWWETAPSAIKNRFKLEDVLASIDKIYASSNNIEQMFYDIAKQYGASNLVALTFSKLMSAFFSRGTMP